MKDANKGGVVMSITFLILVGCGLHSDMAKSFRPEKLYSADVPVVKFSMQDTLKPRPLSKEDRIYRKSISELISNANTAFRELKDVRDRTTVNEKRIAAYDTLVPKVLKQQIQLFERARELRLKNDSTSGINEALLNKIDESNKQTQEMRKDFKEYYKQSLKTAGLERKVKADNSWYRNTVLFCVIGTFLFGLLQHVHPRKRQV